MPSDSFETIEGISLELLKLAEAGEWEAAAHLSDRLTLELARLPQAKPADRAAITTALHHIADVAERAEPAREDVRRLLTAFGLPPDKA